MTGMRMSLQQDLTGSPMERKAMVGGAVEVNKLHHIRYACRKALLCRHMERIHPELAIVGATGNPRVTIDQAELEQRCADEF